MNLRYVQQSDKHVEDGNIQVGTGLTGSTRIDVQLDKNKMG